MNVICKFERGQQRVESEGYRSLGIEETDGDGEEPQLYIVHIYVETWERIKETNRTGVCVPMNGQPHRRYQDFDG